MQIDVFKVQSVHSAASTATLANALKAIAGVAAVDISQPDGRTTVKYDATLLTRSTIDQAVASAGYRVVQPSSCCGGCGG